MIQLISKPRKSISSKELREICSLKNEQWKYNLNSQLKWFKKNIQKNDICNLLKIKGKIIGLTILRKRTYKIQLKKGKYLLFDTLIISKKFRKKKLSSLLMALNNFVIFNQNLLSLLICNNRLVKFYEKFGWSKIQSKFIVFKDYNFKSNALIINQDFKKNQKKKLIFFTNI